MGLLNPFTIVLVILLVVGEAVIKRPSPDTPSPHPPQKHSKVEEADPAAFLGHGGTYEAVQPIASKKKVRESDHAPHYSLLNYLNVDSIDTTHLSEKLKSILEKRKFLEDQLKNTQHPQNEKELNNLRKKIKKLNSELKMPIRVNTWKPILRKEYFENNKKITEIERKSRILKSKLVGNSRGRDSLEVQIAENERSIKQLNARNKELRQEAKEPKKLELTKLEAEFSKLEKVNKELSKPLDDYNLSIKKAMGVLSIPYDKHRSFPSTGSAGLNNEIRALKSKDATAAKKIMEDYDQAWRSNMEEGTKKGYLATKLESPDVTDADKYKRIWEANFDSIFDSSPAADEQKQGKGKHPTPKQQKKMFMQRLRASYAKKFITTSIYFVKTPEQGYARLMNLYIEEYKLYLKSDFDSYKMGIQNLLETNKDFGWVDEKDVGKLRKEHKLYDVETDTTSTKTARGANQWNEVADLIRMKEDSSKNSIILEKSASNGPKVCFTSTRRKRSTSANECVFFSKKHLQDTDVGHDEVEKRRKDLGNSLPSDGDTNSIDSKNLNKYLTRVEDGKMSTVKMKEAVVEHVSRNTDKLTGTKEEIGKTKGLLKQDNLDSHDKQNELSRNAIRTPNNLPAKAMTRYEKVRVSSTKFAAKASTFTSVSNKVGNSYGKIMLAKGVVTAIRHGDYVSLALMGGRVGLEFGLQAVTKLGQRMVSKATTKFMTNLGSNILGKMAGPVGAMADIGINIYSISKAVRILNSNASRFDKNDAIADIVADSIDIAVTAAVAVLSLVIPPLAPIFAAVAFIVNVVITFFVAFYKAANHVDRLNEQIPLLDYERNTEYWRNFGGRETSGYIQDLIDTKRANNIAVNSTVQFLVSNPDYIGRVFPSKTLYDPEARCYLEKENCITYTQYNSMLHYQHLRKCLGWKKVSDCDGEGKYCRGEFSSRKCEWESSNDDTYRCKCGPDPPPQWDPHEILNSEVDFTTKQNVYLQRAAPDHLLPPGFNYMCKPSSKQKDRVSNQHTNREYLCKGAIAVIRSNPAGKFMLYELGTGDDIVRLHTRETTDNLFVVKDGKKEFSGNAGDDSFVLKGPCTTLTGTLDGKGYKQQGNSLVLDKNCSSGEIIQVNLPSRQINCFSQRGFFTVNLMNIHRVFGRTSGTEVITADCNTKLIVGGGGRSNNEPDVINIPPCDEHLSLTISVNGSTFLDATKFSRGKVSTLINGRVQFTSKVNSKFQGTLLFQFDDVGGKLTTAKIERQASPTLTFQFSNGGISKFEFLGSSSSHSKNGTCENIAMKEDKAVTIIIKETNFNVQLGYDLKLGTVQASYLLDTESNRRSIRGYDFLHNNFQLRAGSGSVFGGNRSNHFILLSSDFTGSIQGGSGENYLHINDIVKEKLEINFDTGVIRGKTTTMSMKNIEGGSFRRDFVDEVVTSCQTRSLDVGGSATDTVNIPSHPCANELTIAVTGRATIFDRKTAGNTTIQVGYGEENKCSKTSAQYFMLSLWYLGGGETTLLLNVPSKKLTSASLKQLLMGGWNQIWLPGKFPNVYFEEDDKLKSSLHEEDGQFMVFHELKEAVSGTKVRHGSYSTQNIFKLSGGRNWKVFGGKLDDMFSLASEHFQGELDGRDGQNKLFIIDDINGTVNIISNAVWIQGNRAVSFRNIDEIYGRRGQPESINVECETGYVGMNGGKARENPDIITIPNHNCAPKLTLVAMGYTQVNSLAKRGKFDIYLQPDASHKLDFNSNIIVTNATIFNFPIQILAYKLTSYELEMKKEAGETINLQLKFSDGNFVQVSQKINSQVDTTNVNMLFVDEAWNSNGNILINKEREELTILHVLENSDKHATQALLPSRRGGATGAKNVFRLNSGWWEVFGGTFDDSFLLNNASFGGKIHGLGGVNSLILSESLRCRLITVNLQNKILTLPEALLDFTFSEIIINSIQAVVGRTSKTDKVICSCDTRLVMLEGGLSGSSPDVIEVPNVFCHPREISFVVTGHTEIINQAMSGNFTYHVRANNNFDIKYFPGPRANHAFKFEIPLNQVKFVELNGEQLRISFDNLTKNFPLNFANLPTFQISEGPELIADIIILERNMTPISSIIARCSPCGSIHGLNGVENGITVESKGTIEGIFGGDKDDNIFLSRVQSVLLINGRGGTNRLQLAEELHPQRGMKVDLSQEEITFLDDSSWFISVLKEILLFTGRENSYEKVILGCNTKSVMFAEEVVVSENCAYNVRIQVGPQPTRVIFEVDRETGQTADLSDTELPEEEVELDEESHEDDDDDEDDGDDEVKEEIYPILEPSTFYYHFAAIQSFDIEVDSFSRLTQSRHIFYLNFTLSDLKSLRFSLNDSRLIYSTFDQTELEYSHLVSEVDESEMFFSQPEFMTAEGFLLRITRYGEIIAVVANPDENLELSMVQHEIIPRLSTYSSFLGISFMLETGSDFIYCGTPNEVNLLTNRETVRSHLVGFNKTTYEILDLDHDVYIYPKQIESDHDSVHVIDLTDIVFHIRNTTGQKYIPSVKQSQTNLEIQMANWTDVYQGKVILVNGTLYWKSVVILLNSIAMEITPIESLILPEGETLKRSKRSTSDKSWIIKPRPISIPPGHSYLLAAEDLEDGVEVVQENSNENSTSKYSKDETDLIIIISATEDIELENTTSFIIFDFFSPISTSPESDSRNKTNETRPLFGSIETVNNIQVNVGIDSVQISSNQPLISEETGEEIVVQFYEDILDAEEAKILKDFPDIPRKFNVPWQKKLARTHLYLHLYWGALLCGAVFLGIIVYRFCRKEARRVTYRVKKLEYNHETEDIKLKKRLLSNTYELQRISSDDRATLTQNH